MKALALVYLGGLVALLPVSFSVERWGVFLVQAVFWPATHVVAAFHHVMARGRA
jgi:hypothetical protein